MPFHSPLRYPGGKRKLANFLKLVYINNNLLDGEYVEPYAGGASVALSLLFDEYARRVHINDINRSVYAFWHSVLFETDSLCQLITDTPVTMDIWHEQKEVQQNSDASLLTLGFSTFFLNRTNRSGILTGGVVGGKNQAGKWKIDARYNKEDLIKRIEKIARYKERIVLYNLDAEELLKKLEPNLTRKSLVYLDPPYYVKGRQLLYTNFYNPHDHQGIAQTVSSSKRHWVVSYDNVPEIRLLYQDFRYQEYDLHYSAQARYQGAEVMFFSDSVSIPSVSNPAKVKSKELTQFLL